MPNDRMPELNSNRRKDLIDLYQDEKTASVRNSLNGVVTLEQLTDNYLRLKSDSSSFEMAILTMINDSKIICCIETRCAPVCDSQMQFYTVEWKPVNTNHIIDLVDASWFIKEGTDTSDPRFMEARSYLDFDLMELHFNPKEQSVVQTYNTPHYLNKEEYRKVEPYLKNEPKVYIWQQMQFK